MKRPARLIPEQRVLIRESLADHRGERTMIIITHREKLLELADVVYEVVEGRLVERPHLAAKAA